MSVRLNADVALDCLTAAGLAEADVAAWAKSRPSATKGFAEDRDVFAGYWRSANSLLGRLPKKP